uniref:Uncharacterized protein n=1 Tax=Tanacetum cinerariifolium TaxID=118510 RepID=A0A699H9D3_TANCI|nr:hypothetical protein [Tanacetum cinerariifolium]
MDNKLEEEDRMWHSIEKEPYRRPMIPNPDNTTEQILEPLSKMTEVDACKNAKDMWERIKRLMFGFDVTSHCESTPSFLIACNLSGANMLPWGLQGDSQEDKLTTTMMLLARAITQKFSTPMNNRLRTLSNIRNQAVIQYGRVDIQTKNASYDGNGNTNAGRQNRNLAFNAGNRNDESNQIVQPDNNADYEPSYDSTAVSEVNASNKVHEQVNHTKRKTIINTFNDDQIDSNIIFDDPDVEKDDGTYEDDSNVHDEYHDI